ncbi:hypothetical protein CC2G_008375 [Coprinopsis cinerea AmutBmut pab1-1]|nr:hypothetical protein CC2G_008375 [Coprinopsis cinerea AmutBmut pab1-1]
MAVASNNSNVHRYPVYSEVRAIPRAAPRGRNPGFIPARMMHRTVGAGMWKRSTHCLHVLFTKCLHLYIEQRLPVSEGRIFRRWYQMGVVGCQFQGVCYEAHGEGNTILPFGRLTDGIVP